MSFAKVYSAQVNLLSGAIVLVEVDLSRGLHSFSIVGLPDKAVDESKDRVSGAIKNSNNPLWKTEVGNGYNVAISKDGRYTAVGLAGSEENENSNLQI